MDYNLLQAVWTIIVMVIFIGIFIWAWGRKKKKKFDEASRIPLDDDESINQTVTTEEKSNG